MTGRYVAWTPEEEEMLRAAILEGCYLPEIVRRLKRRSIGAIKKRACYHLGLKGLLMGPPGDRRRCGPHVYWTSERVAPILAFYHRYGRGATLRRFNLTPGQLAGLRDRHEADFLNSAFPARTKGITLAQPRRAVGS